MLNIVTVRIFGAPCLCSGCRYGTNSTEPTIRMYITRSRDLNDYSTVHYMAYVIKTWASTAPT